MTKKLTRLEAFQELSIQLARIEDKLNKLLSYQEKEEICTSTTDIVKVVDIPEEWQVKFKPKINPDASYMQCYFDLHPEDRFRAISVSCPCKKCSPYSMSGGSIQSSEVKTVWMNPRSTLDCVGTDSCKTSEEAWTNAITGELQE